VYFPFVRIGGGYELEGIKCPAKIFLFDESAVIAGPSGIDLKKA